MINYLFVCKSLKSAAICDMFMLLFCHIHYLTLLLQIKLKVSDERSLEYLILFTLDTVCVGFFTFDLLARGRIVYIIFYILAIKPQF